MLEFPQNVIKKHVNSLKVPICQYIERIRIGSGENRGTLISHDGTGLWENYSFIYLDDQLKVELTVCRMFFPKPESDALFCIGKYA